MVRFLLFLALALFVVSPAEADRAEFRGECMGTTWSVRLGSPAPAAMGSSIQAELDGIDKAMSNWKADSEVSRFNASETTDWFAVSPATATVVDAARRVSSESGGAFDVTVAPLIELWSFGPGVSAPEIPAKQALERARARTGWQKVHARLEPPAIRKEDPAVSINLSAIAKGYAVDRVAALLDDEGLTDYLVEIGGEIKTRGQSPKGRPWAVGIEEPVDHRRSIRSAIPLENRALATSGDYRNFFIVDGKRYSHTIDPRTGRPVDHTLASVSVLAGSCMQADAWATAINVLGPEAGRRAALKHGLAVMMLIRQEDDFDTVVAGDFPETADREQPPETAASDSVIMFVAALTVFLVAIGGMAIGVIVSNRRLKGSCGGLAGLTDDDGKTACDLCAMPSPECRGEQAEDPHVAAEQ